MHTHNRLALAISAGLAVSSPAVVHAECPAAVSGTISVTGNTSGEVSATSFCELQAGQSISVGTEGVLSVTADGNGGQAVAVASGASGGFIEVAGEVSLTQPLDSVLPDGISRRLAGVLVPADASLANSLTVSGKVVSQGLGTVRGVAVSGAMGGSIEISGEVIGETTEANTLPSNEGHYGLLVSEQAWNVPVTITDTGSVSGFGHGVALLGLAGGPEEGSTPLGSFINHGEITEVADSGVGGGVVVAGTDLNTFTNTNLIRAVSQLPPDQATPRDGINVGEDAFIRTLTNQGTITSVNGGHGIHLAGKYSDVDTLINASGAVIQAINDPDRSETGAGILIFGNELDELRNEGTISGTGFGMDVSDGNKYAADLTELINLGTIEGTQGGIRVARSNADIPTISRLVNAQSGLTYEGVLPGEYVMYARSPNDYGSLEVSSGQGEMAFRLRTEDIEATVSDDTLYFRVLRGVTADQLTAGSFSGVTDGLRWSLELDRNSQTNWNLCVGDCAVPVPVMAPWGVGLLGGLLGLWGFLGLRRRGV